MFSFLRFRFICTISHISRRTIKYRGVSNISQRALHQVHRALIVHQNTGFFSILVIVISFVWLLMWITLFNPSHHRYNVFVKLKFSYEIPHRAKSKRYSSRCAKSQENENREKKKREWTMQTWFGFLHLYTSPQSNNTKQHDKHTKTHTRA